MTVRFSHFHWQEEMAPQRALFSDCFPEHAGKPPETEAYYHRKFRKFPADRPPANTPPTTRPGWPDITRPCHTRTSSMANG